MKRLLLTGWATLFAATLLAANPPKYVGNFQGNGIQMTNWGGGNVTNGVYVTNTVQGTDLVGTHSLKVDGVTIFDGVFQSAVIPAAPSGIEDSQLNDSVWERVGRSNTFSEIILTGGTNIIQFSDTNGNIAAKIDLSSNAVFYGSVGISNNLNVLGTTTVGTANITTVNATTVSGNGSGLTNVNAAYVTGVLTNQYYGSNVVYYTNYWAGPTNALDMTKVYRHYTTTTDMQVTNLNNVVSDQARSAVLWIQVSAASKTLYIPAAWQTADGARSYAMTNGTYAVLSVSTYANMFTNAAFKTLW